MLLLAKIEEDQRTNNQDFWSIYFVDPLGSSNDFIIDNKSPETKIFHYDIIIDENIVNSNDIEIEKNNIKTVEIDDEYKNILIKASVETDSKEIYKK